MTVLEDEVHRAIHAVAHAIECANRRLRPYDDARVENGDRWAEKLELAGHSGWVGGVKRVFYSSNSIPYSVQTANTHGTTSAFMRVPESCTASS